WERLSGDTEHQRDIPHSDSVYTTGQSARQITCTARVSNLRFHPRTAVCVSATEKVFRVCSEAGVSSV
uniref:Uncharacterized protein n=1 Tax=Peromyscus maniculatus bairdii TaxID=230844 RepID=A0A8C8W136_PERMB